MKLILILFWSILFNQPSVDEKKLFTLEPGEMIVYNESTLKAGASGNGYTIITKLKGKFFIYTERGKEGPFDKLPPDRIPVVAKPTSATQAFKESSLTPEMGFTSDGKMQLKKNGKIITTLPVGEVVIATAEETRTKKFSFITVAADSKTGDMTVTAQLPDGKKLKLPGAITGKILVNAQSGAFLYESMDASLNKFYFTEAGKKFGPFKGELMISELSDQSILFMEPQEKYAEYKVYKNDKALYTLVRSSSNAVLLFSANADKYCEVNYDGLHFSDGKKLERAFLPVVEKNTNGQVLHYLTVSAGKEVIQSSLVW